MELSPDIQANGDEMREEYDLNALSNAVRGKYAHRTKGNSGYEQTSSTNGAMNDAKNEFLKRVHREMVPILEQSVVPILRYQGDEAHAHGTGTLFRIANKSFLITASHVVEDEKHDFAIPDFPSGLINLHGELHGNRIRDFAIWDLPSGVVDRLSHYRFLSVHQADRKNERPKKGVYMTSGYPCELTVSNVDELGTKKMRMRPLTQLAAIYAGDTSHISNYDPNDISNYDPKMHLLLGTPKREAQMLIEGEVALPHRVNGMSGCSIWQVYYEGLSTKHWTPQDAVIVAIQTGVYSLYSKGDVTKGTRWCVVDEFLRERFPELRGPLSLVLSRA